MGCFVVLFAFISPRLALFVILLFSDWVSKAFDGGWILPILGFFLLPWTTLAYICMWQLGTRDVNGFEWLIVIFAFVIDIMAYTRGSQQRQQRA
ncbi:MAG: hypothetical protein ACSLFD_09755 [Solirubrobacterales bacterium]